jgi:hypothetical protein
MARYNPELASQILSEAEVTAAMRREGAERRRQMNAAPAVAAAAAASVVAQPAVAAAIPSKRIYTHADMAPPVHPDETLESYFERTLPKQKAEFRPAMRDILHNKAFPVKPGELLGGYIGRVSDTFIPKPDNDIQITRVVPAHRLPSVNSNKQPKGPLVSINSAITNTGWRNPKLK